MLAEWYQVVGKGLLANIKVKMIGPCQKGVMMMRCDCLLSASAVIYSAYYPADRMASKR